MPANALHNKSRSARRTMLPRLYGVAALEQWLPISRSACWPLFLGFVGSLGSHRFLRLNKTLSLTWRNFDGDDAIKLPATPFRACPRYRCVNDVLSSSRR